jgi:hypothetical protein
MQWLYLISNRLKKTLDSDFIEFGSAYSILGSNSGEYEEYYFLGNNAVYYGREPSIFRRNEVPPSSGSEVGQTRSQHEVEQE